MGKFLNWKQFLWIVVYAIGVVLLRHSDVEIASWIWWVIAIVFVVIFEALATKKVKDDDKKDDLQSLNKDNNDKII